MRSDMAKLIVERPRGGCRNKFPRGAKRYRLPRDADDDTGLPHIEGMKRAWQTWKNMKWQSENLAPLIRFLQSSVGKPWNDVWSEISQHVRVDSTVQNHVRDHVLWLVVRHVRIIDGQPCSVGYPFGWQPIWGRHWRDRFYVHPDTGLLMMSPSFRSCRKFDPPCVFFDVCAGFQLHHRRHRWFMIDLAPITARRILGYPPWGFDFIDAVLGRAPISISELWRIYGGPYYARSYTEIAEKQAKRYLDGSRCIQVKLKDVDLEYCRFCTLLAKRFRQLHTPRQTVRPYRSKLIIPPDAPTWPPYPNRQRKPAQTRQRAGSNPAGGIRVKQTNALVAEQADAADLNPAAGNGVLVRPQPRALIFFSCFPISCSPALFYSCSISGSVSQPAEDAGSDPVRCGFDSHPGHLLLLTSS